MSEEMNEEEKIKVLKESFWGTPPCRLRYKGKVIKEIKG